MDDAKQTDLKHRFLRGGLPPFFLPEKHPERDFQEWMDAYWAKDIQELFRLERRDSFQRFTELVLAQSGGIFDATRFTRPCEVSRPTITNYLRVLEATFVAHVIRPFSTRRPTEIVAAPKVYGFDTGFICYYRGWQDLRDDDLGTLWEHFVLNEIMARSQSREVFYWRDKRGHEVDFVIATHRKRPAAIECKRSANNFDPTNLIAFRFQHPEGDTSSSLTIWSVPSPAAMETYECALMAFGPSPIRFLRRPSEATLRPPRHPRPENEREACAETRSSIRKLPQLPVCFATTLATTFGRFGPHRNPLKHWGFVQIEDRC